MSDADDMLRAAYIMARAAMLQGRLMALHAANVEYGARTGSGVAYDECAIHALLDEFQDLTENALIAYLVHRK